MHQFARGVKQERGAKKDEGGKYLRQQNTKKQNDKESAKGEAEAKPSGGTWYKEETETIQEAPVAALAAPLLGKGAAVGAAAKGAAAGGAAKAGLGAKMGGAAKGMAKDAAAGAAMDAVSTIASIPGKIAGGVKNAMSDTVKTKEVATEEVRPARQVTMTEAYAEVLRRQQEG